MEMVFYVSFVCVFIIKIEWKVMYIDIMYRITEQFEFLENLIMKFKTNETKVRLNNILSEEFKFFFMSIKPRRLGLQ